MKLAEPCSVATKEQCITFTFNHPTNDGDETSPLTETQNAIKWSLKYRKEIIEKSPQSCYNLGDLRFFLKKDKKFPCEEHQKQGCMAKLFQFYHLLFVELAEML